VVDRRKVLGGVAGAVALAGLVTFLGFRSAIPPKPSLPYPKGQSLQSVRGNCESGNEVYGCDSLTGPRSFLMVHSTGDVRAASEDLFASLASHGWAVNDKGLVARDFSEGGASEDIQPVYCKDGDGCVGLFRNEDSGYTLAWWSGPAR
jgi:hypothetical protein